MTLLNQTPIPKKNKSESEDFFQDNLPMIIVGAFLLITLITVFLKLFTGEKKIKKPVLQFMPFYVQRK